MSALTTAVAIYLLSTHPFLLAHRLGANVPNEISDFVSAATLILCMLGVLALLIHDRWTMPVAWRLVAVGAIGGWLLRRGLASVPFSGRSTHSRRQARYSHLGAGGRAVG